MAMTSSSLPWANAPWSLIETPSATKDITTHPAYYIANEMAFAHNAMLRGLNAIYLQAPHVPIRDVGDFLFFVAAWSSWMMHHHTLEEEQMFPSFEAVPGVRSGSLLRNIEQHHEFSEGLSSLHRYANETSADTYSGDHIQSMIDGFAQVLREHLADEIDTLWSMDSVKANTIESKRLLEVYQRCEAEAGKSDKYVVPPMVLGLCDKTLKVETIGLRCR